MSRGAGMSSSVVGWRAWVARLLSLAVLLTALVVPSFAEPGVAAAAPSVFAAAPPSDAANDELPRPDGRIHAGFHCGCHPGSHAEPQGPFGLIAATGSVEHPVHVARAHPSHAADPPSRPPQA